MNQVLSLVSPMTWCDGNASLPGAGRTWNRCRVTLVVIGSVATFPGEVTSPTNLCLVYAYHARLLTGKRLGLAIDAVSQRLRCASRPLGCWRMLEDPGKPAHTSRALLSLAR